MSKKTDNFQAIYKILRTLEAAMDCPEFDINEIGPEKLDVSQERRNRYVEMIADVGLVKGIRIRQNVTGSTDVINEGVRITLKGLEYLTENSIMQRLYNAAKGVKDIVPFT